jgi:acylphosphatase
MIICKRCRVEGDVQGVFYRASTQQQADKYNLTGYAINLPDGSVEVLACGEPQAVDVLCDWLWQGPRHARVEKIVCAEVEQNPPGKFTIG